MDMIYHNESGKNIPDMVSAYVDDDTGHIEDPSRADIPMTYGDTVRETAFMGEVPFDTIIEGIEGQFDDYIKLEDNTNYVDIFYDQLHASYEAASKDIETFQNEIKEVLDEYYERFIDKIIGLFNSRLTLTIVDVESESVDKDELEFIIRRLYEFFILGACNNFKVTIGMDIRSRMTNPINDHKEYLRTIRNLMPGYTPLITTFGAMEFLKYRGDEEIIQMFEEGKVVGNFLRKYSPKLYQNEEFEVELINYISMVQQFKEEVFNNG